MRKSLLIGAAALSMAYTAGAVAEMPAVTGFNAKVDGTYGQLDGEDNFGLGGSVALPLIEQLGLQVDAGLGMLGEDENMSYGAGASLFWRSSSVGSFGLSATYVDVEDAAWLTRYQADGELYLGDLTLSGLLGMHDSDFGGDAFVTGGAAKYYVMPNVAVEGGVDYFGFDGVEDIQFKLGAEVGLADILSVYANGKMGKESDDSISIGLRVAFGSSTSDLKKQHREYMKPNNTVNALLLQNDTLLNNAAFVQEAQAAGGICDLLPLGPLCVLNVGP